MGLILGDLNWIVSLSACSGKFQFSLFRDTFKGISFYVDLIGNLFPTKAPGTKSRQSKRVSPCFPLKQSVIVVDCGNKACPLVQGECIQPRCKGFHFAPGSSLREQTGKCCEWRSNHLSRGQWEYFCFSSRVDLWNLVLMHWKKEGKKRRNKRVFPADFWCRWFPNVFVLIWIN